MTDFTKGQLQVSSGGLALLDEDGFGVVIAPDFRPHDESLANMPELARRWNTHEGLVAAAEAALHLLSVADHDQKLSTPTVDALRNALAAAKGEAVST